MLTRDDIRDMLTEIADTATVAERNRIILFLANLELADAELFHRWPKWRQFAWALMHPVRFERAAAISRAVVAIHRGDHVAAPSTVGQEGSE